MFRLITFNMQNRLGESTEIRHERLSNIASLLEREHPDVVCLQEAFLGDYLFLRDRLEARASVFKPRDDGERLGEGNPVFLLNERWRLSGEQHFWLSRTPHQPSRSWGAMHRRIATVVRLQPEGEGSGMWLANVHLDHASHLARRKSLGLIRRRLARCQAEMEGEVVICGDFNMRPGALVSSGLLREFPTPEGRLYFQDAAHADAHQGTFATYAGWGPWKLFAARVDHCLLSPGLACQHYAVADPEWDGAWLSDHRIVVADIVANASS